MWISRKTWEDTVLTLHKQLASLEAQLTGANKHIGWLERQEDQLRFELKEARQKTEYAIDELLKKNEIAPISPDAPERKLMTDAMESIWDEDPVAVARLHERIDQGEIGNVYAEAMAELTSNE